MICFNKPKYVKVFYCINEKIYWWQGWFGCQLASHEWTRPPAGTERVLNINGQDFRFRIFSTRRKGLFIEATWSLILNGNNDNKKITELKNKLKNL